MRFPYGFNSTSRDVLESVRLDGKNAIVTGAPRPPLGGYA